MHQLVPGLAPAEDVYSVMPLLPTSTLPSFVVATATVAFAVVPPTDGGAEAVGVAAIVVGVAVGVVAGELDLALLEHAGKRYRGQGGNDDESNIGSVHRYLASVTYPRTDCIRRALSASSSCAGRKRFSQEFEYS